MFNCNEIQKKPYKCTFYMYIFSVFPAEEPNKVSYSYSIRTICSVLIKYFQCEYGLN